MSDSKLHTATTPSKPSALAQNKTEKSFSLAAFLFLALSVILFSASIFYNQPYFSRLAYDNVLLYQLKQAASLLLLFAWGYLLLAALCQRMTPLETVLYAFPAGLCLWAFVSLFLLLVGIPYHFFLPFVLIWALVGTVFLLRVRQNSRHLWQSRRNAVASLPALLAALGVMFLVSTGFLYVFVSYDTYFYFTNYGHTLAVVGNFKDLVGDNSFTLTNISQFLPLINAYTSFWGLDQCFQVQAFLTVNVAAVFFYGLYRFLSAAGRPRKALLYSGLFTMLLITSTSFIIGASWVLANMYCMAFLFLTVVLNDTDLIPGSDNPDSITGASLPSDWNSGKKCAASPLGRDRLIVTALFLTALTLLRKDGIIFVCFLLLCFCMKKLYDRKTLFLLFLPSIIAELWWLFYVRVVLKATVSQAAFTSIANNKNVAFVVAAIAATCLYLFLVHGWLQRLPIPETLILYGGMCLLLILLTLRDWGQVVDNVDMTIRNMLLPPSSWGISAPIFGVIIVLALLYTGNFLTSADTFLWLGYVILNFISYCAADKYLWVNWDDSYNRIVIQIIPVFLFICGKHILGHLQSDTPNRNSQS